jgi:hypothetical protein
MGRDFSGTEPKLPCEPVSRWSLRLSALPRLFQSAFLQSELGVPVASLAISLAPTQTLLSPTAGIGTELLAHRENIGVTRSGALHCKFSFPRQRPSEFFRRIGIVRDRKSHAHARISRDSPISTQTDGLNGGRVGRWRGPGFE